MFKRSAIVAAVTLSALGLGAEPARASVPLPLWAQQIAHCAIDAGLATTGASGGGADIEVSQTGTYIAASVFDGGTNIAEYVICIISAGQAPGWFAAVVRATNDDDGLHSLTFAGGQTILWSYESDSNEMMIVVTTDPVTLG